MPRVSEHFGLGRTQAALDFVDVDVVGDTRLFVDPRAIERLETDWGRWGLELLRDFFERVLAAVRDERRQDGLVLLAGLGEPNETHLGMSTGNARGSGVGRKLAQELWEALSQSQARQSGLLEHLEDTALLIEGVSIDRVSDIATNIIREPLIAYTKQQAELHAMPTEQVGAGSTWDEESGEWRGEEYELLPTSPRGALLLVPKVIVRRRLDFDPGEYYQRYILRHFSDLALHGPSSALVRTLKSGKKKVRIGELRKKVLDDYGPQKRAIIDATVENPDLLRSYRRDKESASFQRPPLELEELAPYVGAPAPQWTALLGAVTGLDPGSAAATRYHGAVEALLTALFYPTLVSAEKELEIDQGRKRVDIRYTASGIGGGFVAWLQNNYPPLPFLYVECKNFTDDLGNRELDQLTGRFNLGGGGRVGLLINRGFTDKARFIQRCRDAALKGRGYVVPLDDDDLTALTYARAADDAAGFFKLLSDRFARLVE